MTCPYCQEPKTQFLFTAPHLHGTRPVSSQKFAYLQCSRCGLIFPRVRGGKDFYDRYYSEAYYRQGETLSGWANKAYQALYSWRTRWLAGRFLKTGSVLDFGCGRGVFLSYLPEGTSKYGVEVNSRAVAFVKKNLPEIEIYRRLGALEKRRARFELITLWHVLEHLEKPQETLSSLAKLLKKDGHLVLSTPNSASFGMRLAKGHWFHLDAPIHRRLYALGGLKALAKNAGLRVVAVETPWLDFPLDLFRSLLGRFSHGRKKGRGSYFLLYLTCLPLSLILKLVGFFKPERAEVLRVVFRKA